MGSSHRVGHTELSGIVERFHVVALVSGFSRMKKEKSGKGKHCV